MALFWPATIGATSSATLTSARWGVRIAMLASAFWFTYWVANFNNRVPTPIKTSDGKYTQHYFEVDRNSQRIQIWETWLSKGSQIFDGHYTLTEPELTLKGAWKDVGEITLQLRRRKVR
jgi:hypothetical protein